MNPLWCNGQWLAFNDFPSPVVDRGLLHGLGLFETLLALDGRPVFAERHLARLRASCSRLGWAFEFSDFQETLSELLVRNRLTHQRARIRLAMTAGSGNLTDLGLGGDRLIWMTAQAAEEPPDAVAVGVSPWRRNEHSPLAGLKCASYAENLIALDHARRQGFSETLFFNTSDHLCEAATANVFLVKNGRVLTPPLDSGCLPGITRAVVIDLATSHGLVCSETDVTARELAVADECFLTSSTRGLVAVTRIDQYSLPVGTVTQTLAQSWHELARIS
jgi:branched-subunit amino acid aminotransferase/4-amino-4-deoxychorismate lyase